MPVVPLYIKIDAQTYAGVKTGVLELYGLAKNIDNKRIAKHIPAVTDDTKECASNAIDFIRLHRSHHKGSIIFGGAIIIGGAVIGTIGYVSHRKQRKLDKQFGTALQKYLDSARSGSLNIDILDNLIFSIETMDKENPKKTINLNISADQFIELINFVFDYTMHLAKAKNISTSSIKRPKSSNKKTSVDLKYYLNLQKQIFEQVA